MILSVQAVEENQPFLYSSRANNTSCKNKYCEGRKEANSIGNQEAKSVTTSTHTVVARLRLHLSPPSYALLVFIFILISNEIS